MSIYVAVRHIRQRRLLNMALGSPSGRRVFTSHFGGEHMADKPRSTAAELPRGSYPPKFGRGLANSRIFGIIVIVGSIPNKTRDLGRVTRTYASFARRAREREDEADMRARNAARALDASVRGRAASSGRGALFLLESWFRMTAKKSLRLGLKIFGRVSV